MVRIASILSKFMFVDAFTTQEDQIGTGIADAVQDFSSGPIAKGFENLAVSAFKKMFGANKGTQHIETR